MTDQNSRTESDSLGEVHLPADALYGAQTQRAVDNFPISGRRMHEGFVRALLILKRAAAQVNEDLDCIDGEKAAAISAAVSQLLNDGALMTHFPVDVYQTGSGTSTNMNANEVIAHVANSINAGASVHPNDHVNFGQSSNDVIPSSIHLSLAIAIERELLPALQSLMATIESKAKALSGITKTGRTHLMDAMPVRFDQILGGWNEQLKLADSRLQDMLAEIKTIALGGTAVGTGVNTHPDFAQAVAAKLTNELGLEIKAASNPFPLMGSQDTVVAASGQLKALAVSIMKISNDLRWMNSGPLAGLGEIVLPALQPGSSIMPGKVNPVIPEAATMVCARVMGNDVALGVAGQSGNFELNVMLPLVADTVLESTTLLTGAMHVLAEKAIDGFEVNHGQIEDRLGRNPILVTALNPIIGYSKAAQIAKKAYATGAPIIDVAADETDISREELAKLLDPAKLTAGGL
ncbi:MAG: class II fumarate hydratase [Pseudomonadota bacterium]